MLEILRRADRPRAHRRPGERDEAVRILVLASSRAPADRTVDLLSDYDVTVATTDLGGLGAAAAYGAPLARRGDEHRVHAVPEDGVEADWTLRPAEVSSLVARHGPTDDLDVGHRVLPGRNGETAARPGPAYRARVPKPAGELPHR